MYLLHLWEKYTPKAVLYIDNLDKSCTVEDLTSFVTALSVNVKSCFKVTPRHRRGQKPDDERSAFRLCISSSDLDKLLDSTVWPDCVVLAEWYRKDSAADHENPGKRRRYRSPPQGDIGARNSRSDSTSSQSGQNASTDQIEGEDMESTVIYKEVTADNADRNDGV